MLNSRPIPIIILHSSVHFSMIFLKWKIGSSGLRVWGVFYFWFHALGRLSTCVDLGSFMGWWLWAPGWFHTCVCELGGPVGASRSAWVLVFLWIRPHGFQISVQFSFCAPATKPCSELIYVCVDDFSFDSHIRLYNIIICVSKLTGHSNSRPTVTQAIKLKISNLSSHRLNISI